MASVSLWEFSCCTPTVDSCAARDVICIANDHIEDPSNVPHHRPDRLRQLVHVIRIRPFDASTRENGFGKILCVEL